METIQFVHIGDAHLQSTGSRNAAKLAALDQVIAEGSALPNLGAWLVPGDLFHTKSSVEDRNDWSRRLRLMANRAPVAICYGNHDVPGDLDILGRLEAKWGIYVFTEQTVFRMPLATGHIAALAVLPYPTKAGLVSAGIAKGDVIPAAAELLDLLFVSFAGELQAAMRKGDVPLFMGHVNVAGSLVSNGQPQIGMEIEIDASMLGRLPAVYCALNHIHKAQAIGGGVYAGSIAPMSWGEIESKAYNVVDCTRAVDGQWVAGWQSELICTAALYHVEGLLTRDGFTWQVTAGPGGDVQTAPASWRGCEVRVRYKFAQSEKSVLDQARVLVEFVDAARLEVEPIAVPDRALRSPEVAAARTLAEKLAAYQQAPALTPSLSAKLAVLEHSDSLAVIGAVQQQLAAIEAGERAMVAA